MFKNIFSCCTVEKETKSVDLSRKGVPIDRNLNPESNIEGLKIDL